jgi:hypothetical protein
MFYTAYVMKHPHPSEKITAQDYAALRQSGTQASRARVELSLAPPVARGMERLFQARVARGAGDRQLPKFARHDRHVAAVLAEGGFWALSERRIGRETFAICLPLLPPGGRW